MQTYVYMYVNVYMSVYVCVYVHAYIVIVQVSSEPYTFASKGY